MIIKNVTIKKLILQYNYYNKELTGKLPSESKDEMKKSNIVYRSVKVKNIRPAFANRENRKNKR